MRYTAASRFAVWTLVAFGAVALTACSAGGSGGEVPDYPYVSFTVTPSSGAAPLTVTFDALRTRLNPNASFAPSFNWDFGDGSTCEMCAMRVEHTYSDSGMFTVTLTVWHEGATNSASHTVSVTANSAPVAAFSATPKSGIVPFAAEFDASGSQDPEGAIAAYEWNFGDGSSASGSHVLHTYLVAGNYQVSLSVSDEDGAVDTATEMMLAMSGTAASRYSVTEIPSLGGGYVEPSAVNSDGQVVGRSYTDEREIAHAFLYSDGVTTDLGSLAGETGQSFATAINDAGDIVGTSDTGDGSHRAFLYRNGQMTDLGTLGGLQSDGRGINNAGVVVGYSDDALGVPLAFMYSAGGMTSLGHLGGGASLAQAINDQGQVAGESDTADAEVHAFIYEDGVFADIGTLGGTHAWVAAINNLGDVIGLSQPGIAEPRTGFLYRNGAMHQLSVAYSEPMDINNAGVIVGYAHFEDGGHAMVWDEVKGMQKLADLVDHDPGWTMVVAQGINDRGQIVGHGTRGDGSHVAVLLTPVIDDEPVASQ